MRQLKEVTTLLQLVSHIFQKNPYKSCHSIGEKFESHLQLQSKLKQILHFFEKKLSPLNIVS